VIENNKEFVFWSNKAQSYDRSSLYVIGGVTLQRIERWLTSQFTGQETVLEMGCGTGYYLAIIGSKVKHVTAMDISWEMLGQAKARLHGHPHIAVVMGNCYQTSFSDNIFDAVRIANMIHVVQAPLAVMMECSRVLQTQGRVVVIDYTSYRLSLLSKLGMAFRYLLKFGLPPSNNKILSPDDIATIAEEAGFQVEESILLGKGTNVACLRGRKKTYPPPEVVQKRNLAATTTDHRQKPAP
jgi:ubiquinone/menaquinone biosynthesis C-methylase UbiE